MKIDEGEENKCLLLTFLPKVRRFVQELEGRHEGRDLKVGLHFLFINTILVE